MIGVEPPVRLLLAVWWLCVKCEALGEEARALLQFWFFALLALALGLLRRRACRAQGVWGCDALDTRRGWIYSHSPHATIRLFVQKNIKSSHSNTNLPIMSNEVPEFKNEDVKEKLEGKAQTDLQAIIC